MMQETDYLSIYAGCLYLSFVYFVYLFNCNLPIKNKQTTKHKI